ncbi:hypothetical protein CAPTEDRAFT_88286, partial [Capitella teleta]
QVLDRLQQYGLVLRPEKCFFGVPSIQFLGHQISATGCIPLPSKVATIRQLQAATNHKALHCFLGSMN